MARAGMAAAMALVVLLALSRLPESAPVPVDAALGEPEAMLSAGPGWRAVASGSEASGFALDQPLATTTTSEADTTTTVGAVEATTTTTAAPPPPPPSTTTTTAAPGPPPTTAPPPPPPPTTTTAAPPVTVPSAPAVAAAGPNVQVQEGVASWFGAPARTCAHLTIPKGTEVKVTLLTPDGPGPSVTCVIADYGPTDTTRIIDLSDDTFEALAPLSVGLIEVRIEWS